MINMDFFDKWRPGSYAYCIFGGAVYKVKIDAIGYIESEHLDSYHVRYYVPIGTARVKVNWYVGRERDKLFETFEDAVNDLEGVKTNG